jgi:hypothetical protein
LAALPPDIRRLVRNHNVRIGMKGEYAAMAWGEPDHINTTITGEHTMEQWVYSQTKYLYVEDGIVVTIQY